jgi:hypothetical protein
LKRTTHVCAQFLSGREDRNGARGPDHQATESGKPLTYPIQIFPLPVLAAEAKAGKWLPNAQKRKEGPFPAPRKASTRNPAKTSQSINDLEAKRPDPVR